MTDSGALLTPTLAGHVPRDWGKALPWRLGSQVYVAIIGGPLAVTIIAALNARRLRMSSRQVAAIVVCGVAGLLVALAVVAAIDEGDSGRLVFRIAGVLAYGPMYLLQRAHDRVHSAYSPFDDEDDDYESLWGPGIAAVVGGALLQAVLAGAVA